MVLSSLLLFCLLLIPSSKGIFAATPYDDDIQLALSELPKCCTQGPNIMENSKCIEKGEHDPICPDGRYSVRSAQLHYVNGTLFETSYDGADLNMSSQQFCMTLSRKKGVEDVIALVCFLPMDEMAAIRHEMHITSPRILACLASVAFAMVTLTVYWLVPDLRDLQGKSIMNFLLCMIMGYLLLTITQMDVFNLSLASTTCELQAFSLLFWMLAQFFWLNVICINVWRNVRLNHIQIDDSRLYLIYNVYAWGTTSLIVLITIILHYTPGSHISPGIGDISCWLRGDLEYWTFFYGPILLLLFVNTVLFIFTAMHLWSDYTNLTPPTKIIAHRYKFLLYAKLFLVMGMTWLFEPLAFLAENFKDDPSEQYLLFLIFDYINLLQGIFIFVILIITRKRALRGLAQTSLCGYRCAPASWANLQRLEEEYDEHDDRTNANTVEVKINE